MVGRHDFLDPFGNHWQVVDYRDVQFTKADRVLDGMGLGLAKSERALGSSGPKASPTELVEVRPRHRRLVGDRRACALRLAPAGWRVLRRRAHCGGRGGAPGAGRRAARARRHGSEQIAAAAEAVGHGSTGSSTTPASRSLRRSSSSRSTSCGVSSRSTSSVRSPCPGVPAGASTVARPRSAHGLDRGSQRASVPRAVRCVEARARGDCGLLRVELGRGASRSRSSSRRA